MFNVVLLSPEYPGNVGNIGRSSVLTQSHLHLVRPFKFDLSDKSLKRAGIDYWDKVNLTIHDSIDEFLEFIDDKSFYLVESGSEKIFSYRDFKDGDYLIFGRVKEGIDKMILDKYDDKIITIPMSKELDRSLNLANSVNVVLYEALRQNNFNF